LERSGGEVARASSIVRYQPRSRFHSHRHDLGEEFLVLEGAFSDEQGHYPVGTYVRNPPGSSHAPFSTEGCVIFVKLRQMRDDEHESVRVLPANQRWCDTQNHARALLYANSRITVTLERLQPGAKLSERSAPGGEEILVVAGNIRSAEYGPLATWSWLRNPVATHPSMATDAGALLWIKRGHLV
jgi:anti-sigma factor ChrR (cupin superfamily)